VEFQRKRFSLGLKHSIQMEFGFVVKYLTEVWCAYGVHFVQNTANGCVAFATSATPSSTAKVRCAYGVHLPIPSSCHIHLLSTHILYREPDLPAPTIQPLKFSPLTFSTNCFLMLPESQTTVM